MRILVVEDDPNLGMLVSDYLKLKGWEADLAVDGQEGVDKFTAERFDFVIMDVMMPRKDGFTAAKEIKAKNPQVPVLFLTARAQPEDVLKGFEVGGDDYVNKPFSMEELVARVKAISKRVEGVVSLPEGGRYQIGKLSFDYNNRLLLKGDELIRKLTTKESDLMRLLAEKKNQVLSREIALKEVWGEDTYYNGRSMDVYITKLRKYLKPDENLEIINVHGQGFKLLEKE